MTIKEAIIEILKENKDARNNDTLLSAEVYKLLGYPTELTALAKIKNKPSLASIVRWRRKIQEYNPNLSAEIEVVKFRDEKKIEFLEIARQSAKDVEANG